YCTTVSEFLAVSIEPVALLGFWGGRVFDHWKFDGRDQMNTGMSFSAKKLYKICFFELLKQNDPGQCIFSDEQKDFLPKLEDIIHNACSIMSQMFDSNKNLVQIIDSRKSTIFTEDLLELEQYLEKIVTTSKVPHK
uniref:Uncharacterized protein n=1 Tax=Romanomermis culicivorax TaxID=13658 RepID=A0A915IUR8_ROMCU